ncbi:MAG: hypothetical protein AAB410_05350 [Patescibacteria group bacterium]
MKRLHTHITAGLAALSMLGSLAFFLLIFTAGFLPSKVQATPGMIPFGGRITVYNPVSVITGCPSHTVIFDYVTLRPVGIALLPSSQLHEFGNLFTPGVHVLGEYVPTPFPTCTTPYLVFPIFQVGTSLIP